MTPEEIDAIGCNESSVHTDMMISSDDVDVVATNYGGEEKQLLAAGEWMRPYK